MQDALFVKKNENKEVDQYEFKEKNLNSYSTIMIFLLTIIFIIVF